MRSYVGICDACGDLSIVPEREAKNAIEEFDDPDDGDPIICRCAIIRELDGEEMNVCRGDVRLRGMINLAPLRDDAGKLA